MQQLEVYFGFRVTLGKSITNEKYKTLASEIERAIQKVGVSKDSFELYICQVRIERVESHFDQSPLSQKVREMQVHLAVNKRHREDERMYFINDRVKHSLADAQSSNLDRFDLKYNVAGSFFDLNQDFHEVIFVVVHSSVRMKDRKLKVKFLARPTSNFGSRLRNVQSANTQLDLDLDPRIQLRFDL